MPQTILALFALVCATYYASTRQRGIVEDQVRLIQNEVELIGASVAVDRLEEVSSKEYDTHTADSTITSASRLTPVASLGYANEALSHNDIDDFHNVDTTFSRTAGTSTLSYRVQTTVTYGVETAPETVSTTPTKVKTVTATVTSQTVSVASPVILRRSFTCGAECNW